jgi:hypothetical protein
MRNLQPCHYHVDVALDSCMHGPQPPGRGHRVSTDHLTKRDENWALQERERKGRTRGWPHGVGSLEKSEDLRQGAVSLVAGECDRRLLFLTTLQSQCVSDLG